MRLIDADNFVNNFRLLLSRSSLGEISPHENVSVGEIAGLIKDEPTAFDLKRVIGQFEECKRIMQSPISQDCFGKECKVGDCTVCAFDKAIEILKSAANATNGKNGS